MRQGRAGAALFAGLLAIVPLTGCAKAHAKAAPDGPGLQVPQPPARVIVAASEAPPLPVDDPPVVPSVLPAPPAVTPRPAPVTPPRATRPDPPVPAPPARVEPRTLRAPGDVARERAIRERLATAVADIGRVETSSLGPSARAQYDQARRFLQQAEQAIKDQNLAFASTLADKAAALAADLAGR